MKNKYETEMIVSYHIMDKMQDKNTVLPIKIVSKDIPYSNKEMIGQVSRLLEIYDADYIEVSNWGYENDYEDITIMICKKPAELGKVGYIHTHKVNTLNFSVEDKSDYKREANRIKQLLVRKFPNIKVTSNFCWR